MPHLPPEPDMRPLVPPSYEETVRAQAPIFFCGDEAHDHHQTKASADACRAIEPEYSVGLMDAPGGERKAFHGAGVPCDQLDTAAGW